MLKDFKKLFVSIIVLMFVMANFTAYGTKKEDRKDEIKDTKIGQKYLSVDKTDNSYQIIDIRSENNYLG